MQDQLLTQLKKMHRAYRASGPQQADTDASYARFLHSIREYDAVATDAGFGRTFLPAFVPQLLAMTARGVGVAVIAVLLVVGTGAALVHAFPSKLPGDLFYGVKLAAERAQVSLAFESEDKARLELEFAGRRIEEVSAIAESSLPDRDARLSRAVAHFRTNMKQAQTKMQNTENTARAVEVAKTVDRKSVEYGAALERAGANVPAATSQEVRDAQDAAHDASITAVNILLEGQRTGEVSLEELRKTVRAKLWELESALQAVAYRLTALPGGAYPEIAAVGGPTLSSLYQDLNAARAVLEDGKDLFAAGGYDAALAQYRDGVGTLNHLTWATGLYEKVLLDREAAEAAEALPETPTE